MYVMRETRKSVFTKREKKQRCLIMKGQQNVFFVGKKKKGKEKKKRETIVFLVLE